MVLQESHLGRASLTRTILWTDNGFNCTLQYISIHIRYALFHTPYYVCTLLSTKIPPVFV